jgi:hypothetical protein
MVQMRFTILVLAMLFLASLGAAYDDGPYPYYTGYWAPANAYWHAEYYASSFPGENTDYDYHIVYAPGGYAWGTSIYDEPAHQWAYDGFNGGGYRQGTAVANPYYYWQTTPAWL